MTSAGEPLRATRRSDRLRFDRYVLDLERGSLLLEGDEVALRPKTFAILRHLVENAGRMVSKDELFAAVWPNLAISDDVLVQSISELRRALGADGPRLITTIPRRGYRFEPPVAPIAPEDRPVHPVPASAQPAHSGTARPAEPLPPPDIQPAAPRAAWARLGMRLALPALAVAGALGVWWLAAGTDFRPVAGRGPSDMAGNAKLAISATPSIAVLPFDNQSDDRSYEYFADGLTQDIVNALGRFSALTVMSWNAVFPYKGKAIKPDRIGQSLGVRYIVEGGVRRAGERVRVMAQLADAERGRVLWSARYDEALADVFALQDRIATEIVGALAIRVTQIEQRRVLSKPTTSLEAYEYVLRARPALQRPTRANNVEARAFLRQAIALDPNYAAAYAALAETYHIAMSLGWAQSPTAHLNRAEQLAIKSLSLNANEVHARIILGRIHIFYQRYKQAEVELERALAINPNDAHGLAGRGNILLWLGQTDRAIEALERAQRIDPEMNAIDRFALALAYYLKQRYDDAIALSNLNLQKAPSAGFSRVLLAAAYAQRKRMEDAANIAALIRRLDPIFDPRMFGTKLQNAADLDHLRDGLRKAGLYATAARSDVTNR